MESLPEELVVEIASSISCPASLANFALVSRQLNRISTPLLYHHVSLCRKEPTDLSRPLRRLTLTLLERPNLAACVHTFSLRPQWLAEQSWSFQPAHRKKKLERVLKVAIDCTAAGTESKRWKADARDYERHDAILAILLPRLLNLQRLDLAVPPEPGKWWRRMLIYEQPLFASHGLQEFVLDGHSCFEYKIPEPLPAATESSENTNVENLDLNNLEAFDFDSFLRLNLDLDGDSILRYLRTFNPKIVRLDTVGGDVFVSAYTLPASEASLREHAMKVREGSDLLRVQHLEIRGSYASSEFSWKLLSACKALTTFMFEFMKHASSYQCIINPLSLHKSCLRFLCLDIPRDIHQAPFEGLREFTALEHLKIASSLLLPRIADGETIDNGQRIVLVKRLPPNITRLSILRGEHRPVTLPKFIAILLASYNQLVPALRILEVTTIATATILRRRILDITPLVSASAVDLSLLPPIPEMSQRHDMARHKGTEHRWGMDSEVHWPAACAQSLALQNKE